MKIKDQIIGMLAIPILFQLLSLSYLVWQLAEVDDAVKEEARAKQVITTCLDTRSDMLKYNISLWSDNLSMSPEATHQRQRITDRITKEIEHLGVLVGSDSKGRLLVDNYAKAHKALAAVFADLDQGEKLQDGVVSPRFLETRELIEELLLGIKRASDAEQQLYARYAPVVRKLAPEALNQRQSLRYSVLVLSLLNILVLIGLGVLFNLRTLTRLRQLTANMACFAQGRIDMLPVAGKDEIADLDSNFRLMAVARHEAEELRRSMYAMVSHDLRTPLTTVRLSLENFMLRYNDNLEEAGSRIITKVSSEINRIVRLVTTLLDLERMESGTLEINLSTTALCELLDQSIDAVYGLTSAKKIRIETEVDCVQEIICDCDRVIQILINLLSNAAKFAPANSDILLRVVQIDGMVRFEVLDRGPGVPEDSRNRLFQKFSQLQQDRETKKLGSGLGLYICSLIATKHGGFIGANFPESGGSCFWFSIPLNKPSS